MQTNASDIQLPKTLGPWIRPDQPRLVTARNIFEYMNGAGELYLAYRFERLEVLDYTAADQGDILVELYYMTHSDDAFGLLSMDWGGEQVLSGTESGMESSGSMLSLARALYGGGLLRIWSDDLYVRILAERETAASKEAVLSLGRRILQNRRQTAGPALLTHLPQTNENWHLRRDRTCFLRSHLVLNSIHFISHDNILLLDHTVEAVTASYASPRSKRGAKPCRILLVRYANSENARKARRSFHGAYLSEFEQPPTGEQSTFHFLEDGWLGYKQSGPYLAIVFEATDSLSAQKLLLNVEANLP